LSLFSLAFQTPQAAFIVCWLYIAKKCYSITN
jgi:hypothetical protein